MYEMLDEEDATNVSEDGQMNTVCFQHGLTQAPYLPTSIQIRTVFFIDPRKIIRAMLIYPASVGRDFDEIIRYVCPFPVVGGRNSQKAHG